jgi:hypothetical protein
VTRQDNRDEGDRDAREAEGDFTFDRTVAQLVADTVPESACRGAPANSGTPSHAPLYDYIVLTAAITRPDLHSRVFPGHLQLIGPARVKWLINVDDVGTAHSVDDTIDNLKRLLLAAPNVDLEFFRTARSGCFFQAARRLVVRARELLVRCRTGIVWLEDDWQLATRSPTEEVLSQLRLRLARNRVGGRLRRCPGNLRTKQAVLEREAMQPGALWFVSLVPRSRISFNPGIWSKTLFERAIWRPLASQPADRVNDPETLCADPWNEADAYRQLTVFVDPLFQDAGRQWSAERGFAKWAKVTATLACRGTVTYASGRPRPIATGSNAPQGRTGWVELPGRALGTGLPLVGRVVLQEGRLMGRLLAVPHLLLELHLIKECAADVYLHRLHRWSRTYPFKKTDGRLTWSGDDRRLELQTRRGTFAGSLSRSMPASALWMAPLQASAGLIMYAASLIPRLMRLDAETKTPLE